MDLIRGWLCGMAREKIKVSLKNMRGYFVAGGWVSKEEGDEVGGGFSFSWSPGFLMHI